MLGDVSSDILAIVNQGPAVAANLAVVLKRINPYLGTVRQIVDDPAFPTVMQRVQTLIAASPSAASAPSSTPATKPGTTTTTPTTPAAAAPQPIQLQRLVPVLDSAIYIRQNPWVLAVGGGLLVLLIGGVGYRIGRRSSR